MSKTLFFDESTEQSRVKSLIVSEYFLRWARVIVGANSPKIAYLDLFAGPGRYGDGTLSTPLLILQHALQDNKIGSKLITYFNDKDQNNCQTLESSVNELPGIETLRFAPSVYNREIGTEVVKLFEQLKGVPTFFFVDPWGYKGLSLQLVNSVIKNWGCDCIFFFNYNRINMGLTNPVVKEHMDALFGSVRTERLRDNLKNMNAQERELTIVEEVCEALIEMGGKYVLPFCFKNAAGNRTSHHLIFVSKHFTGYDIMKHIMASQSSSSDQGVPSLTYNPATERQPLLFELTRPLDFLEDCLKNELFGKTIVMKEFYEQHSVRKPFIRKNYTQIFDKLQNQNQVTVSFPNGRKQRKKLGLWTYPDDARITFIKK